MYSLGSYPRETESPNNKPILLIRAASLNLGQRKRGYPQDAHRPIRS